MAVNAQAYFSANPDVAASYAENAYGMTPQQFADFHYENYGRNEQRSPTGSVSSQQILDFLTANPNLTDAQIVKAMETYGVSPAQMAQAVGLSEGEVASRAAATIPNGQTITLGDTIVQPVYQVTGSGDSEQVGGLENVITYKATENKAGGAYTQYTPTGEVEKTGTQQEVKSGVKEFVIGAGLLLGLPTILNAGAATGAAATVGTTGLTTAELALADLSLGGAGGTLGAETLASALTTGATVPTLTNLTGVNNAGLLTTPNVASAVTPTATGTTAASTLTPATTATSTLPATTAATTTAATALTPTAASVLPAAVAPAVASALTPTATTIATSLIPTAVNRLLTPTNLSNLFSGGLGTAGSLLQMQQSKEAAQAAQQRIDAETAAAKASAAFRPVGMTTRFGTSQFAVDPVTGQLTSAGYTLSPEAKNAQDRLVKLAESGLVQAEGAQKAFEPLQTGAQTLFGLGNQYLAQNPQDVAQNYLNQQMALLQPGRELELANLQNRLQQQGRGGLSVAQGGALGATTPELQALFNARAQQEAVLAANAQQAGQQQVAFGAGLLGTGAQTMGQYYGGQQAAYAPYTNALGQVQNLESMAQQPLQMGATLGQQASAAGARMGELGLRGAGQSVALATGADATRNLGAQSLIAAGNPNAMFGQAIGGLLGGGLQSAFSGTGLGSSGFGTGLAYGNQDLGLFL
jgi:hypothetical protein